MRLSFTDQQGHSGTITEDLEVRYDGPWSDEVEAFVDRLEADRDTDEDVDLQMIIQDLLLDLPEEVPVTEVRRREVGDCRPNGH